MSSNSNQSNHKRWVVLGGYTLVAGVSQMLWLNFAPLITIIQDRYLVSELEASSLIWVFPGLYVLLSLHAGAWIDRHGYRFTVGLGSIVMAVFACVRIYDSSFLGLLIGQIGIAIAQPYIVNGISKLVADWFEEEHHGLATGIGTIGMFLGMAIALALTPAIHAGAGMQYTMIFFALLAVIAAIIFLIFVVENPDQNLATGSTSESTNILQMFAILFKNKNLIILFLLAFFALGFFNGLTTWLEKILAEQNIGAEDAGLVGAMLILGGNCRGSNHTGPFGSFSKT